MSDNPMSQYWATILYEDSVNSDWQQIVSSWLIPAFAIHHESEGVDKKAHTHLMLMFPKNIRRKAVSDMFQLIGGAGAEQIRDKVAYARYLCHIDQSEKKQYSINDIISFSGANYENVIKSSKAFAPSDLEMLKGVLSIIQAENITIFRQLVDMLIENNNDDLLLYVTRHTTFITQYMRSIEYEFKIEEDKRKAELLYKNGMCEYENALDILSVVDKEKRAMLLAQKNLLLSLSTDDD